MALFGMGDAGKDAQNQLKGIAGSLTGNANEMDGRSDWANSYAEYYRPILEQLYKNLYENGFSPDSSPDNWIKLGNQILPSIQSAIDNGSSRFNDLIDPAYRGIRNANETADARRPYLDEARGHVVQENAINSDLIRNTGGTARDRNGNASGSILHSVDTTRDDQTADSNSTLGAIEGRNGNDYDTLANASQERWGGMKDRVGTLLDFDNAASARSFAPAKAAAARRLRSAGISPDSLEADSVMGRVDNARARAFDDNRSANIGKINDLSREEYGIGSDLLLRKQANAEALERDQLANRLKFRGDAADKSQAETLRRSLYDNDVDAKESALLLDANNKYFGDMRSWDQAMADEETGTRDRQIQDWQNAQAHAQAGAATDQNKVALETQRASAGQDAYGRQLNQYLQGAQGMQGMWTGQQGYALGNNGQAQSGWQAGMQPYQSIYQQEAQNSNWLGKGLLGLAGTAIGGFAGGVGGAAGKSWFK